MTFSRIQEQAIWAVDQWLNAVESPQVFYLGGYAGTGKTTLAITLAQNVLGRVFFATYTGKAAHVMRSKGCPNASTIHQLIYHPRGKDPRHFIELQKALEAAPAEDSALRSEIEKEIAEEKKKLRRPSFGLNEESDLRHGKLLIIDECSMVDERIGQDLLSFGVKVLVLGDPAQLPPVRGEGFFTSRPPDLMLTEIHRQAAESPIIRMASGIREGRGLPPGDYGSGCLVGSHDELFSKTLARSMDQCITGRNATRKNYNTNYRKNILGIDDPLPVKGDRVVCLRNNHDVGILNGQLWAVEDTAPSEGASPLELILTADSMDPKSLRIHREPFLGQDVPFWDKKSAEEFDYGYALTAHKAQGSQWPSVLVFDESRCFKENADRWLYTAVTRAAERVVVLR